MPHKPWYTSHKIADGITAISDHGHDTMYLVTGEARALLIDTGWGFGDLAGTVAALTSLPLVVANTHGHPDHILGDHPFAEVHIAEADLPLAEALSSSEGRDYVLRQSKPELPPGFDAARWIAAPPPAFVPIAEGHRFDLGGRVIEALAIPGHSPGSLAYLDEAAGALFTGDSVVASVLWLHLPTSLPLSTYHAALQRLRSRAGDCTLYPAHAVTPQPPTLINAIIAGVGRILAGDLAGRPTTTFAGDGLRCDFEGFSILYDPEKL